jgi:hypothetical protein
MPARWNRHRGPWPASRLNQAVMVVAKIGDSSPGWRFGAAHRGNTHKTTHTGACVGHFVIGPKSAMGPASNPVRSLTPGAGPPDDALTRRRLLCAARNCNVYGCFGPGRALLTLRAI